MPMLLHFSLQDPCKPNSLPSHYLEISVKWSEGLFLLALVNSPALYLFISQQWVKLCRIYLSLTYFTNEVVEPNVHSTIPARLQGSSLEDISPSMEMLDKPGVTKMRYRSKKRSELWSLRGWAHHSSLNHSVTCYSNPKKYPMTFPLSNADSYIFISYL